MLTRNRALVEVREMVDLRVDHLKPRFLPYTTCSRMPQSSILVRLYLAMPLAHVLLGKQAWMVASKQSA